jgi:hypothetical protein
MLEGLAAFLLLALLGDQAEEKVQSERMRRLLPAATPKYTFYILFHVDLDMRARSIACYLWDDEDKRAAAKGRVKNPASYIDNDEGYEQQVQRLMEEIETPYEMEDHEIDNIFVRHWGPAVMEATGDDLLSEITAEIPNVHASVSSVWVEHETDDPLDDSDPTLGVKLTLWHPDLAFDRGPDPSLKYLKAGLVEGMADLLADMHENGQVGDFVIIGVDGPGLPAWDPHFTDAELRYVEGLELLDTNIHELAHQWRDDQPPEWNWRNQDLSRREQWLELLDEIEKQGGKWSGTG